MMRPRSQKTQGMPVHTLIEKSQSAPEIFHLLPSFIKQNNWRLSSSGCHEHGPVEFEATGLQLGRKHRAKPGGSELADGSPIGICTILLELINVGKSDDF